MPHHHFVTVRMSDEDLEILDQAVERLRLNRSAVIRISLREYAGSLKITTED